MKNYILILLLIFIISKPVFVQTNSYFKNDITDDVIYNGLKINDYYYYYYLMSSGTFLGDVDLSEIEVKGYNNYLLKFDESLNVVDSVSFDSINEYYINFYFLMEYNDTLVLVGNALKNDLSSKQIIVEKYLLPSLAYIDRQLYGKPDVLETINDVLLNHNGNIIAAANNITDLSSRTLIVLEISKNGDLLNYLNDTTLTVNWATVYQMPNTLDYIFNNDIKTIVFDSTLNNNYTFAPPNSSLFRYYREKCYYNDSSYIIAGNMFTQPPFRPSFDISYFIVNNQFEYLDSGFIYLPDTNDKIAGIGLINPSTLIYGGTHNRNWTQLTPEFFEEEPRWIVLKSEDIITKNENWFFSYGGDANYVMRNILITENNSCIVSCTKYDWQNTDIWQRDVLIFEVDSNGVIVSNNTTVELPFATVYPNPGKNNLSVRCGFKNGNIKIIDQSGQTVLDRTISKFENIDVSGLNPGLYVIMFYEEGKFMFSQKWIKS